MVSDVQGLPESRNRDMAVVENKPEFLEMMEEVAHIARQKLMASQVKAKVRHDKDAAPENIQVGDLVMIEERFRGKGAKLLYRRTGPYRVKAEGKSPNVFDIELKRGELKPFNREILHKYFPRGAEKHE